ncbi:unnamed protein product [Prorocentrum cordatum]|uniref:Uncharacterized protein n=1 Tax=Prorocentrum cordatum TaxID=2364126 RepID=A0ABN9X2V6_9DINO|nr:unnamed protein product [Polarella glacialis]|mmetsp:Transcript_4955/g.13243  ORF Transcript_4955/g.13243 Transcript_4955/m.13243 type:complete len:203 (+) Transcript_4955:84-692(+)
MAPMRLLITVALFGTVAGLELEDNVNKIRRLSLLQRKDKKKARTAHRVRGEDISGAYADPKHEGHLRHLLANGKTGTIKSTDDGTTKWEVPITELTADSIVADFSGKGGPKALSGKLTDEGIQWEDGNTWTLMSAKASKGVTVHTCKTMCQRWGMKALGRAFDGIKMPQPCVAKCEEVYPEDMTPAAGSIPAGEEGDSPNTL